MTKNLESTLHGKRVATISNTTNEVVASAADNQGNETDAGDQLSEYDEYYERIKNSIGACIKAMEKLKSEVTYLAVRNQAEEWKAKGDGLLHTCWVDFKYPEEDAQKSVSKSF